MREPGDHRAVSAAPRQRRSYDPQIRRLVAEGRGDDIVRRERIPRSTVSGWRNRPLPTLVSVGPADGSEANLRAEIAKLPVGSGPPRQRSPRPRGERADPIPTMTHMLVSRIARPPARPRKTRSSPPLDAEGVTTTADRDGR